MKAAAALCLAGLMLQAPFALAAEGRVVCGGAHYLRAAGAEARSTLISLRNLDLVHSTTVERITIRNAFGNVVHDSGPATGVPHPSNDDFMGGLDITTVPPGASYYIATGHIWPGGEIPSLAETGKSLAITVEFSKAGRLALFEVSAVSRTRETASPEQERARDHVPCTELRPLR